MLLVSSGKGQQLVSLGKACYLSPQEKPTAYLLYLYYLYLYYLCLYYLYLYYLYLYYLHLYYLYYRYR